MKYKDKNFIKSQDKQRFGGVETSQREERRSREHRVHIFYSRCLSRMMDKFWWNNLKIYDKESIQRHYICQMEAFQKTDTWWNLEVFDSWEDWKNYIVKTYKSDKSGIRKDKLKTLGI